MSKKLLLISICSLLALTACEPDHLRILESEGIEDPVVGGAAFFGCSDDDSLLASNTFTGRKNGQNVEGYICCGLLFKGCTIRYR